MVATACSVASFSIYILVYLFSATNLHRRGAVYKIWWIYIYWFLSVFSVMGAEIFMTGFLKYSAGSDFSLDDENVLYFITFLRVLIVDLCLLLP